MPECIAHNHPLDSADSPCPHCNTVADPFELRTTISVAELSDLRRYKAAVKKLERTVHGITMVGDPYIICVTRGERWNYGHNPMGSTPTLLEAIEAVKEG